MSYPSYTGQTGSLEVDLNFMFRQPLWNIRQADSHPLGDYQAKDVPLLDIHELVAGKLSALFSRRQARDLFDCHRILDPTLRARQLGEQASLAEYGAQLLGETRRSLSALLPFTEAEQAFLDLLLDKGEIDATILTSDSALQQRIQIQPLLEWKASTCAATRDYADMKSRMPTINALHGRFEEIGVSFPKDRLMSASRCRSANIRAQGCLRWFSI